MSMDLLIGLTLNLAPALLGVTGLLLFIRGTQTYSKDLVFLLIGTGPFFGYVSLALIMAVLLRLGLNPFPVLALVLQAGLAAVLFLLGTLINLFYNKNNTTKINPGSVPGNIRPSSFTKALTIASLALTGSFLIFLGHENWLRPAVAWDTTWYWAINASHQIESILNGELVATSHSGHHPSTISLILVWTGYWTSYLDNFNAVFFPWWLLFLGNTIAAIATAHIISKNGFLSCLTGLLVVVSPVTFAHVALAGYADLWMASSVVLASFMLISAHQAECHNQTVKGISMFVLLATSSLAIKNSGLLYLLVALSAATFTLLFSKKHYWLLSAVGLASALIYFYIAKWGLSITAFGQRINYDPSTQIAALGDLETFIPNATLQAILKNFWEAYVTSSSLGFHVAVAFVCMPLIIFVSFKSSTEQAPVGYIFFLATIGMLGLAQLSSQYFFSSSQGLGGTGLNRASIALNYLAAMALLEIYVKIENLRPLNGHNK